MQSYNHTASYKFAEIARLLNMRETTVKTFFYRALPLLQKALAAQTHLAAVSGNPRAWFPREFQGR